MPTCMRMSSSHYSLGEDDIKDEKQHDARSDEDLSCDCYSNVSRSCSPDHAHDHSSDAGHAEAEYHA